MEGRGGELAPRGDGVPNAQGGAAGRRRFGAQGGAPAEGPRGAAGRNAGDDVWGTLRLVDERLRQQVARGLRRLLPQAAPAPTRELAAARGDLAAHRGPAPVA